MGSNPSLADIVGFVLSTLMFFGLIVFLIYLIRYLCVRIAANATTVNRRVPHAIYTTTVTTQYPPTQPPVVVGTNSSMPVPTQF